MSRTALLALSALALTAAAAPLAFADAKPGLWELTTMGSTKPPAKLCVKSVMEIAAIEHGPQGKCTFRDLGGNATSKRVNFSCAGGGFGQASMTIVTPRNIKVETQGLADGAPYNYTVQARRLGDC